MEGCDRVFVALRWWGHRWDGSGAPVVFVGGLGVEGDGDDLLGLSLQDDVAHHAEVLRYLGCVLDGDEGQSALVGLFFPLWRLQPFGPRNVLVLVF